MNSDIDPITLEMFTTWCLATFGIKPDILGNELHKREYKAFKAGMDASLQSIPFHPESLNN